MTTNISASVGKGGANQYSDVVLIQLLLNNHIAFDTRLAKVSPLVADGKIDKWSSDDPTVKAITAFQKHIMGFPSPDGRIDPIKNLSDPSSGKTLRALCGKIGAPIPDPNKKRLVLRIASVSWISRSPNPVSAPQALYLTPDWVPKTYVGLIATSNPRPPDLISDFVPYDKDGNFRALMYFRVGVTLEGKWPQQKVGSVELEHQMLNPGWTPPFRTDEFPMMKPLSWIDSDIADRNWYAGELSPLSAVTLQKLHPNSTLKPDIPAGEEVIASGLIKFRAGAHTDKLGVSSKVGCPFHVPWVWCETAVTYDYDRDDFKIYGRGAQFPSHAWYKNGEQLMSTNQVGDSSLPTSGLTINLAALKLYQILKKGAPAGGPQPAAGSDASHGPVSAHHYSVGAGERRIHRRL